MRHSSDSVFSSLLVAAVLVSLIGCQGSDEPAPSAQSQEQLERITTQQRELALTARKELFDRLSGRLMEVMSEEGPAAAISVCSDEARTITQQVGDAHGVKIGRTSFRLRNSQNVAPSWATGLIQQRSEEPQFVNLPNGELGALLPIHLKPQCLLCHGAKQDMPAPVQQALAQAYPDDQATDFALDALRGWFWIEVPQSADASSE